MKTLSWRQLSDQLPSKGQLIACRTVGTKNNWIFFAGQVTEIYDDNEVSLKKDTSIIGSGFLLTSDTWWYPLPD